MEEDGKSTYTNKPGMVARLMELKKRRQHIANGKLINISMYTKTLCSDLKFICTIRGAFVVVIMCWFDLHLCYCVACVTQRRHIGITIRRLASASQNNFCHIFLRNHTGQLLDIWHRASVWRTVSSKTVSNLPHVHFLFATT